MPFMTNLSPLARPPGLAYPTTNTSSSSSSSSSSSITLIHATAAPQQSNGSDCGLFALEAARRLCCACAAAAAANTASRLDGGSDGNSDGDGGGNGDGNGDGDGDGDGDREGADARDEEDSATVRMGGGCMKAATAVSESKALATSDSVKAIEAVLSAPVQAGYMDNFRRSIRELIRSKARMRNDESAMT